MGSSSNPVGDCPGMFSPPLCFLSSWKLLSEVLDRDKGIGFSFSVSFSKDGLSGILSFCMVFALELRVEDAGLVGSRRENDLGT